MAARVGIGATEAVETEAVPDPAAGEPTAIATASGASAGGTSEPAAEAGEDRARSDPAAAEDRTAASGPRSRPAPAAGGTVPGVRAAGWIWLALAGLCPAGPALLQRVHSSRLAHVRLLPP